MDAIDVLRTFKANRGKSDFSVPFSTSSFPGMIQPGNIDIAHRPVVHNADGSISTVRSMGIEADGRHILIPTVSDDGKVLSPEDAVELFRKTGKHLGVFDDQNASDAYAQQLHKQQENFYIGGSR